MAHTEYLIEGHSRRDVREVLRETMFAPTVTGSPLENACRIIRDYEPSGRGYYSGVLALIGSDERGSRNLDSCILIRTADINNDGRLRIGVGATVVRHSDPASEAAETRAKAAGLLDALGGERGRLGTHPRVRAALEQRNATIARFWLGSDRPATEAPGLAGRTALVIDAEDNFTMMLSHQLQSLGLAVTARRFDERYSFADFDIAVLGPGPGDPQDADDPKIAHLRAVVGDLLANRLPFLAVCLSHQVLCRRLGFPLHRRDVPNQGLQREIDFFGARERVGFYNTFAARSAEDKVEVAGVGVVEACRDHATGEVHALRGAHFASIQFHAESVLTQHGPRILGALTREVLGE